MALNIKRLETPDHPCSLWRFSDLRLEARPIRLSDEGEVLGQKRPLYAYLKSALGKGSADDSAPSPTRLLWIV
jgi:hypothetical protein